MQLSPRPAPLTLIPGVAPPPDPPLEVLVPNPVPTDPRRRVFSFEEDHDAFVVRLVWDSEDPDLLEAECRAPVYRGRPPEETVSAFWRSVKALVAPIAPVRVDSADPLPVAGPVGEG